jgi:hypothetical protein
MSLEAQKSEFVSKVDKKVLYSGTTCCFVVYKL